MNETEMLNSRAEMEMKEYEKKHMAEVKKISAENQSIDVRAEVLEDLKTAMKEKQQMKMDVLRSIKGAIDKYEKENDGKIDYVKILKPLAKQRTDSAAQFRSGNNEIMAINEEFELEVINSYLVKVMPKQMNSEQMQEVAGIFILENSSTIKDIGKIMAYFKSNFDGQYDGKILNEIIKQILNEKGA